MDKGKSITRTVNMELYKTEVHRFLENILHVHNVEEKYSQDKIGLLKEITLKFQQNIPFHNLSLLATDFSDRCLPSNDSIRDDFLSGIGGLCYSTATFVQGLLTQIGYRTHRVACTIPNSGKEYTHVACVVNDVTENGDSYLVDVGAGFPTFEPISLNSLPQHYHHAFLTYKFAREDDGTIVRYHKAGKFLGNLPSTVDSEGWQKFYEFKDLSRDDDFFKTFQEPIYTVPTYAGGWYLKGLKMTFYPDNKAITLNDYVLKLWDEESNELKTFPLENSTELEKNIRQYFPCLDVIDVQRAVANWNSLIKGGGK